MSDVVWQTLIQVGFGSLVTLGLAWLAQRAKAAADKAVEAVAIVQTDLRDVTIEQNAKLDNVAAQVETVHRATNSIVEQLVAKTEAEGVARGALEERGRADTAKGSTP